MVWFLVSECMFGVVGFIRNNVSGCTTRLSGLFIQLILNESNDICGLCISAVSSSGLN